MRPNARAVRLAMMVVLLAGVHAAAHHSFAAEFDAEKPVTLKGTVVKWEMINPHGWITMDVTGPDGKTPSGWSRRRIPNGLMRLGWTKRFAETGRPDHGRGIPGQGRIEHSKRRARHSGGRPQGVCGFFGLRHAGAATPGKVRRRVKTFARRIAGFADGLCVLLSAGRPRRGTGRELHRAQAQRSPDFPTGTPIFRVCG